MSGWQDDFILDEVRETKQVAIGVSRGLRDVQQSLKANGLRPPDKAKPARRASDTVIRAAVSELLRPATTSQGGRITFEKDAIEVARSLYPGDSTLHDWIRRAAVSPATTTTTGYGAELVPAGTIDFLTGGDVTSGFAQLFGRTLNVPVQGNVKIPARAHPATLSASWTVENAPKPVYSLSLSSIQLTANKITAISCWTDEIERWSVPAIEQVVSDSLRRDIGGILDSTAFGTAAATGAAPAGLFASATSVTASTATPAGEAMLADLGALQAAVATGAPDARPVFIANGKQGLRLNAAGFADVIVSNYMAINSVGCIDANSVATLMGPLSFLASPNATLHMDTAPAALAAEGAANISAPVSSAFQMDLIALRSVLYVSWKTRRSGATALATAVTW